MTNSESEIEIETGMAYERIQEKWRDIIRIKNRNERIKQLTLLVKLAATPAQKLMILLRLVEGIIRLNSSLRKCIPIAAWKRCVHYIFVVLDILQQYPNIVVGKYLSSCTKYGANYKGEIHVCANLAYLVTRIDAEFNFSFDYIEPRTPQYEERLRDEHILFALCQNVLSYFEHVGDLKAAAKVAVLLGGHVYYKPKEEYNAMRKYIEENNMLDPEDDDEHHHDNDNRLPFVVTPKLVSRIPTYPENCRALMDNLISLIKNHGKNRNVVETMLSNVYHRAVMDDISILTDISWERSLMDKIQHMHILTKMSYYRTIAQVGLCAYRNGHIHEAKGYLSKLFASGPGRVEDRLAQNGNKGHFYDMPLEQASWEHILELPYHVHIDLDHLKDVYQKCLGL